MAMKQSRRSFLRALGLGAATGAAASYLPLFGEQAAAADGFPKRLLVILAGNGTVQERYWPTRGGGALDLSTSPILSPLAPFQDRMVLVEGVKHALFDHGPGRDHVKAKKQCLTQRELLGDGEGNGAWPGESMDHAIARTIEERLEAAGETPPPVRLLLSSVNVSGGSTFSATGPGATLPSQADPRVVFDDLFAGFSTAETGGPDPEHELQLRERSAVFEAVAARLSSIENRVGVDGRRKTEAHLESITRLQTSLAGIVERGATCGRPDADFSTLGGGIRESDLPTTASLHAQIIASAFACDLTRVATFTYGGGPVVPDWVDAPIPIDEGSPATIHTLAHKGTRVDKWGPEFRDAHFSLEQWRVGKILELLGMLDAVTEGSGTMLDNTLVVWTSDMARGNHDNDPPAPVLLMGGAGGALETGRHVTTDANFLQLLTAVSRLMDADVSDFGDSRFRGDIDAL
jgi:hypothetical protein